MEHLALEIYDREGGSSQFAVLEKDASITITRTSEVFDSGSIWSFGFTLNAEANIHIIGTVGDLFGSRLHEQIDKRQARLWVDGAPLYSGRIRVEDEVEISEEGDFDVSFESGQKNFTELIDGGKANQVPLYDKVRFGVALWRRRYVTIDAKVNAWMTLDDMPGPWGGTVTYSSEITTQDPERLTFEKDDDPDSTQRYPSMVFPKGVFDIVPTGQGKEVVNELNTDKPYTEDANGTPITPYCNIALCYQKYGYEKENASGEIYDDYSSEPEPVRGYEFMPPDRVNSAPNFYVIYWLRCLMKYLGIHVEENQMMDVEDLRRLFFVNTKCAYKEPKTLLDDTDPDIKWYHFEENDRLLAERTEPEKLIKTEECGLNIKNYSNLEAQHVWGPVLDPSLLPEIKSIKLRVAQIYPWSSNTQQFYYYANSRLHDAYATSECFPDADISDVISAIENGFGVRFVFSTDYKCVRIVLLRNILRSNKVQEVRCEIVDEDVKVENNIRGFRMTYGQDTTNTHFYYKGFADKLPHKKERWADNSDKHDYSQWDLNAIYAEVLNKVSAFNKTCYVTPATGNAYIVKVDKDAKRYKDLHPSLFGCADFMDAEDGDCTGEEDSIKVINVGFTPAIMNDLNMEEERADGNAAGQCFALFVDERMRPRRPDLLDGEDYNDSDAYYDVDEMYTKYGPNGTVKNMTHDNGVVAPGEFAITSDMVTGLNNLVVTVEWNKRIHDDQISTYRYILSGVNIEGHLNEGYRLYLQDNFDPNDDGVSPIETHDWGLTLGIMRGAGYGEHGEEEHVAYHSTAAAHPDTCDCYGNEWIYPNGIEIAGKLLESIGIDDSFVGRWQICNPDSFDIGEQEFVTGGGDYWNIFCQDNVLFGGRQVMITPVLANGSHLTYTQYNSYVGTLRNIFNNTDSSLSYDERMQTVKASDDENLLVSWTGNYPESVLRRVSEYAIEGEAPASEGGGVSLRLRGEKLNPYYDPKNPGAETKYLNITEQNLRQRGLADQMYKEYSYWIRNARIVKRTVRMELAQLLAIDMTQRVKVGDITGFIKKMKFSVSNETGLGNTELEIYYI